MKKTLTGLTIDDTHPGTILQDFDAIIDILKDGQPLTATHLLPLKLLRQINARMKNPIETGLKRPVQKSYPHIHGLYLVVRASGLTYVDETGKKPVLRLDDTTYQSWQKLNPTERYFNLMETWFIHGHGEIIGEIGAFWAPHRNVTDVVGFVSKLYQKGGETRESSLDEEHWLKYEPGYHNLGLLDLFGLITITVGEVIEGEAYNAQRVDATPLGIALMSVLWHGLEHPVRITLDMNSAENPSESILQDIFQPFFPEWKNNLQFAEEEFQPGTHTFKVTLWKTVWRRIAINANQTMDDLALAILASVDFDNDHLYEFRYRNRFGATETVSHPYMDEPPLTYEVRVGEMPLSPGMSMIFLFDFGDSWEFNVSLESIDTERTIRTYEIVEVHGDAPPQYQIWE